MKRRDFLMRSGALSLAVAAPISGAAVLRRPALLDDPRAWVGSEFVSDQGVRLRLSEVTGFRVDAHTMQASLQFEVVGDGVPVEGNYRLSGIDTEETLFLQCGQRGPVACINRLHRSLV
jgi:hypothetical protein